MIAHCESVSGLCTSRGKHGEVGSPKLSVLGGGVFESGGWRSPEEESGTKDWGDPQRP